MEMEMGTSGLLLFYGSYFLLSALLIGGFYLKGKHFLTGTGWIIFAGTVLVGSFFPFSAMFMGLGLSLALYMLLAFCMAWVLGKSSPKNVEESSISPPAVPIQRIHLPLQIHHSVAAKRLSAPQANLLLHLETEREVAESLADETIQDEMYAAGLLSFEEVAASQDESSPIMELTDQAGQLANSFQLAEVEEETIQYNFPDDGADQQPVAIPPIPAALQRKEASDTEEEDQIIYFFDDEPTNNSLKPQDARERERDSAFLEASEWNFVDEDQEKNGL